MGGNLFKLGRIPKAKYLEIEAEIRLYLDKKIGDRYLIPRYYTNKPDFGDLDIIVSTKAFENSSWDILRQEIVDELGVTQYKSGGNVFSTVYQNFQVDYFVASESVFVSTYNYLSFNDLGNIIGKICRRFNLKYGEKGLAYVYRRYDGQYKKDLTVTTDFREISAFLGLNYDKWKLGFTDLDEMFAWAIASPYFSVKPYLDKSNSLVRREKNRQTMQKFIAYLESNNITKTYEYLEREAYISLIHRSFPEAKLLDKIAAEQQAEERAKQINAKFRGKLVMELIPSLKGKELGEFMVKFKSQFDDFERFILSSSQAEINQIILKSYQDL